ncbi:MAG: DUF4177 domain-containing protein [Acidobacteria bacterium]|nr:DUF4177 domain-containing protein [Acidobacteriota bacterium]
MQKWEYVARHVHTGQLTEDKIEVALNALGTEGWELVSVIYSHECLETVYFFKRPKS